DHAAVLHALVMSAPDDFAVEHEHGADGDAAFGKPLFRFVNRGLEKWIHVEVLFHCSSASSLCHAPNPVEILCGNRRGDSPSWAPMGLGNLKPDESTKIPLLTELTWIDCPALRRRGVWADSSWIFSLTVT